MKFKDSIKTCLLKKYATFSGRATRTEFWFFYLYFIVTAILATIIGDLLFGDYGSFLLWGVAFIHLVPLYSAMCRRLHDTGRSGWWILISLIPYVGQIVLYAILFLKSDEDNKYGSKLE